MRVFLTGATGFIGSAIIPELLGAGHQVLGLTRSESGAAALRAAGAEVHHGSLEDLDSLRSGAAAADATIHCAFIHDFSRFVEVCGVDGRAIEAMGDALAGSGKPFLVSAGTAMIAPGQTVTEEMDVPANSPLPRVSEPAALATVARGVRASVIRLPQVHDPVKQGLVTYLVDIARQKGVSAYVGDGSARWAAGHISDTARLYRLALEKGEAGAKYHAVGELGVPLKQIAEALGRGLGLPVVSLSPEEAGAHFGPMAMFAGMDLPASSELTQQWLGWKPTGPGLLEDLGRMDYSAA